MVECAPSDFERGMAFGRLLIASGQAEHHLSGLTSAVGTIASASGAGAFPTPGMPTHASLASALRALADRLDEAAATPSATADALEAA